ncbi:membrane fusion protein (multidrug efflux system) [Rhizomicrobium palustre]|uniref:Membrane fusion protein (Multidrug efflux system) n=1 Tax=Rhizomicrobium palustre TaxID=189966 RepID=A0A846MZA6_9PROT|nr:efflux RND transporter periplasmic adaptor subunit [Rhizomicrobium palustre]NIK88431.1 membrane fusion protein (multidrug efflux system) [Rhizomicrobium palustre]
MAREETLRDGSALAMQSSGRFMTGRMRWVLIISGIVFALLILWLKFVPWLFMNVIMSKSDFIQPQAVSTTHAVKLPWQGQVSSVGTLHAVQGADMAAEVAGIVTKINFQPGQDVQKGDLLIQLRDDSDRGTLAALRATADQYTVTYKRNAALAQSNAISKQAYDQALANWKSAVAQAEAQAAMVEKKAIRAPFSGRIGIRQVDVGQYVNAGTTMVTLQQLDPINVDFTVAQQQAVILKPGDPITVTTDAVPGKVFKGKILALDPKVDSATRNVRVRAEISNPGKILLPGMFANVSTDIGTPRPQLTLPQTAVTYNPYGDVVYVVTPAKNDKGKDILVANQRFVTVGETRGDQVAILSGITEKDVVVSAGQLKLKNGAVVFVNNSIRMPNDAAPNPIQQ